MSDGKKDGALVVVEEDRVRALQALVDGCPNPTQDEIRRLLSIQGSMLHQIAMGIFGSAAESKKNSRLVKLALEAMQASRESLVAASRILVEDEDEDENLK